MSPPDPLASPRRKSVAELCRGFGSPLTPSTSLPGPSSPSSRPHPLALLPRDDERRAAAGALEIGQASKYLIVRGADGSMRWAPPFAPKMMAARVGVMSPQEEQQHVDEHYNELRARIPIEVEEITSRGEERAALAMLLAQHNVDYDDPPPVEDDEEADSDIASMRQQLARHDDLLEEFKTTLSTALQKQGKGDLLSQASEPADDAPPPPAYVPVPPSALERIHVAMTSEDDSDDEGDHTPRTQAQAVM